MVLAHLCAFFVVWCGIAVINEQSHSWAVAFFGWTLALITNALWMRDRAK